MSRPAPRHAPQAMTREYNLTIALSKVDMCRIEKLDDAMLDSISRAHKVPVERLRERLAERVARHG